MLYIPPGQLFYHQHKKRRKWNTFHCSLMSNILIVSYVNMNKKEKLFTSRHRHNLSFSPKKTATRRFFCLRCISKNKTKKCSKRIQNTLDKGKKRWTNIQTNWIKKKMKKIYGNCFLCFLFTLLQRIKFHTNNDDIQKTLKLDNILFRNNIINVRILKVYTS